MGQRVNALHSLLANEHAPLGFDETRTLLRAETGVTGRTWTEAQLLDALALLEESRQTHLRYREAWARRRSLDKARGRRQPTKAETAALEERAWFKDVRTIEDSPRL
jgi:hypothetical protein